MSIESNRVLSQRGGDDADKFMFCETVQSIHSSGFSTGIEARKSANNSSLAGGTRVRTANGQFCFDFADDRPEPNAEATGEQLPSSPKPAVRIRHLKRVPFVTGKRVSSSSRRQDSCCKIDQTEAWQSKSAAAVQPVATQATAPAPSVDLAPETQQCRRGGPVKIGATMMALLRRYGITEQEIAEGIAAYAARNCQAAAS